MGSDTVVPGWPDCSGPLAAFWLESCFPGSFGCGARDGGWTSQYLSQPGPCVCVCACAGVCVARSLPGSHSAGPPSPPARSRPFHVASTWSLWTTSGTPIQAPSEFTAGVWGPGRVHIWTHGHILLTAAFRREKVFAHLVGRFQLLLMNRFFVKSVNREVELQLFP